MQYNRNFHANYIITEENYNITKIITEIILHCNVMKIKMEVKLKHNL